jgi:hypothetical protein
MLGGQLRQLGLSLVGTVFEDHKVYVTIIFRTTKLTRQGPNLPIKIFRVRSMDVAATKHTTSITAIRYLENATNTTVKDLNYDKLKLLEEAVRSRKPKSQNST